MTTGRIRFRRGTTAEWATAGTVLAQGEPGVDLTTGTVRVGDGATPFLSLPALGAGGAGGSTVTLDADGTLVVDGVTVELATDADVAAVSAALAGKLATTGTAADAAKIGGVAVMGTPAAGQVLKATSGTAAAWQADDAGGAVSSVVGQVGVVTGAQIVADATVAAALAAKASTASLSSGLAGKLDTTTGAVGTANLAAGAVTAAKVAADVATQAELDAAIAGLSGTYAPLASPALTGNPTAPTPTAGDNDTSIATTAFVATAAATAAQSAASAGDMGSIAGAPIQPAQIAPGVRDERWGTLNFKTGVGWSAFTTTPSLTSAAATSASAKWGVISPPVRFRLSFDWTNSHASGQAAIRVYLGDTTGTSPKLAGTEYQWFTVKPGSGRVDWVGGTGDFLSSTTTLVIEISVGNNTPGGTISLSNISVRELDEMQPQSWTQKLASGNHEVYQWVADPGGLGRNRFRTLVHEIDASGPVTNRAYIDERCNTNRTYWYDPFFRAATGDANGGRDFLNSAGSGDAATYLRHSNNDQIISIKTPGGQFAGFDLRGNVHGGETVRAGGSTMRIDKGAGWQAVAFANDKGDFSRRTQMILPTEYFRVNATPATKFADVDRKITFFPDGMERIDRTMTFTSTETYGQWFEWMSTHQTGVAGMIGRIGSGRRVVAETDTRTRLANPATATLATATTGGTVPAGKWVYIVTAKTAEGETDGIETANITTTGATSTITVTWAAVAGATGYGIYRRDVNAASAAVPYKVTDAAAGATTYVDDGSAALGASFTRRKNTAVVAPASQVSLFTQDISARNATWAVWYEPRTQTCIGNILDLDAVLARPQVESVSTRMMAGKIYQSLNWTGGGTAEASKPGEPTVSIPSGTVWTATHWTFQYVPADKVDWHREISDRAANLTALKALYPTT